ncbi:hypothetical protein [Desulfosporosinus sp. OT]|uniref:hypothetical protein n=1 Tax=Desulfosporosinus sp. OT TaxID=913865 RepID=UPI0002239C80|nr:hypothetical protein [Desulfosporosinus sp. OT]EGW40872.1 hypothetical protein DOT_1220 [Desulfosporosinus sp. OT]
MFITDDPKGKVYQDLLDFAFSVCDQFIVVIRKDINITKDASAVLESLAPFLIAKREQFEWPGTRLGTGRDYFGREAEPAIVYYFKTDHEAKRILLEVSNSLHSWMQPNLPEDLSFIKNQNPWLINSSHESVSYFETEDKDEIEKIMNIEDLQVRTANSIKNNIPQVYTDDSPNMKCIFCEKKFKEGDTVPESNASEIYFVCLNCMDNGLTVCNEDGKIFNEQLVNKDYLIIDKIQILKIEESDLLEYITNKFINMEEGGGVCSKKCFNSLYINDCIMHLQTYLALVSMDKESTSDLTNMIKGYKNIENILMNKINELKTYLSY